MADKVKKLKLSVIEIDSGIQPRAKGLDEATVEKYREAVGAGDDFPPLVVYYDAGTKKYRLSEGFHRAEAFRLAGKKEVECIVRAGDRRDARLNACGSNATHGLPRSNADKRRAVEMVLEDYPTWSNPRIAKNAGVTTEFVRKIRPTESGETREGADGKNQLASKGDIQTKQVATVATCDSESAEKNADSTPQSEVNSEPDTASEPAVQPAPAPPLRAYQQEAVDASAGAFPGDGQPVTIQLPTVPEPDPVDDGAEFVKTVETLCRDADQIAARMKALKASRFSYSMHIDSAVGNVEAARKTLWQGRPAHGCPYCKGEPDGCKPCNNTGRVKKTTFDSGNAAVGEAA